MPSYSFILRAGAILSTLSSSVLAGSSYTVQDEYRGVDFLKEFNFITDADPTNGFVTYVFPFTLDYTHANSSDMLGRIPQEILD